MRILFLSFYYPPDLSAGSFRAKALVDALQNEGFKDLQIQVMTTIPNRYDSYKISTEGFEIFNGLKIRRIALSSNRTGKLGQAKAFIEFARAVWVETKYGQWDIVLATSGRFMTAVLAAQVAKRSRASLYLDIRDLFSDTMNDLLAGRVLRYVLPVFRLLEKRTLKAAQRINVVSEGFLPFVTKVAPNQIYRTYTNGIDGEFLLFDFNRPVNKKQNLPLVVYAGNFGDGQGLHKVIPEVARLLQGKVRFRLIGDGSCRSDLDLAISDAKLFNVEMLDPVPRAQLFEHYREADVLFLHLNDHQAFHKVLPSKLFEYAATGKPILAGVAGYPAKFLLANVPGVEVFKPCDVVEMIASLERLIANTNIIDRKEFCARYDRQVIMRKMAKDILSLRPFY
jgi:glycosyltransferase involved in cell wall biosynthesis